MIRPPPIFSRTDTLFPYTPLFRSPPCSSSTATASSTRSRPTGVTGLPSDARPRAERVLAHAGSRPPTLGAGRLICRSEEHTSELQSLMRIPYAVFCLKKKNRHVYTLLIHYKLIQQSNNTNEC